MLVTVQLSMTYWGEAAASLQNLTLTSTLGPSGITLFEVFFGHKPNVSHLWVWGESYISCLGFE